MHSFALGVRLSETSIHLEMEFIVNMESRHFVELVTRTHARTEFQPRKSQLNYWFIGLWFIYSIWGVNMQQYVAHNGKEYPRNRICKRKNGSMKSRWVEWAKVECNKTKIMSHIKYFSWYRICFSMWCGKVAWRHFFAMHEAIMCAFRAASVSHTW